MTTKDIVCMDCGKLLSRLKGITTDSNSRSRSLCYDCATTRYEKTKREMRAG